MQVQPEGLGLYAEECFRPIVRNVLEQVTQGGPGQVAPGDLSQCERETDKQTEMRQRV